MRRNLDFRLYLVQRLAAVVMVPFVLIHLGLIIYAIGGGLTAAEILARTEGSLAWALFYGLFVLAAAIHGAIGLRNILDEITPVKGAKADLLALVLCGGLIALGLRAVGAIT